MAVSMKDVRASIGFDCEEWKASMHGEVCSLLDAAMEVVPPAEAVKKDPKKIVPMKLVATLKPTDVENIKKKKIRGVICGNFIKKHHQEQCYTTNTNITSVRAILAVSAMMG